MKELRLECEMWNETSVWSWQLIKSEVRKQYRVTSSTHLHIEEQRENIIYTKHVDDIHFWYWCVNVWQTSKVK
jgi:hypothetical protein